MVMFRDNNKYCCKVLLYSGNLVLRLSIQEIDHFISDTRSQHDVDSITSSTISWDDNVFDHSFEHAIPISGPSKEDDKLETMKKQGAIPKSFHRPLPPLPEPSPPKEGRSEFRHSDERDIVLCQNVLWVPVRNRIAF